MLALLSSPSPPLLLRSSRRSCRSDIAITSHLVYSPPIAAVSSAVYPSLERSSSSTSHYAILGIPTRATTPEIKSAYRRLARKCHPDVAGSGARDGGGRMATPEAEFIRIHSAYATLSDPEKRAAYDSQMFNLRLSPLSSISSKRRHVVCGFPGRRNWETDQCWG